MKKIKRISAMVLALVMILSLAACGKSIDQTATQGQKIAGGTITTMIQTEPDNFDPFIAVAADTTSLLFNVYDGLMCLKEDGTMDYDLATSYKISDDGLTYTFVIGTTAVFSNGKKLTMDDVVYSYKKYKEKVAQFANVDSVSADGQNLIVKLKNKDASFISICSYGVAPADQSIDLNKNPTGSGPYMVTSYVTGSQVVFEKNPYYATNQNRKPNLDKIIVKVNLKDASVALNQLMANELDLGQWIDASAVDQLKSKGFNVVVAPSNTVQLLAMNNKVAPFDNLKVRQAVNYAIDKDAIVKNIMFGQSDTLLSHMSPVMSAYYTTDLKNTYSLNLDKAKQLLKEAGYEKGFTFTIKVASSYDRHVNTALLIKDMLAKINITVNIEKIEWATWLEDVYANRNYEGTVIGIAGKSDPDTIMKIYSTPYNRNFYNYSNPKYDALIAEGAIETDITKRKEIYKQCQQILVDDAVCAYTMDPANIKVAKSNIGGVKNYPIYYLDMASMYLTK